MFTKTMTIAAGCAALTFGCSLDDSDSPDAETEEIIENLVEAGFPEADIQISDGLVFVGRDAQVSLEASREMLDVADVGEEQYRTNNLVSRSLQTICIDGRGFNSSNTISTALNWSINNYNRLGLTFRMRRTSGSTNGCNAVIRTRLDNGGGGSAGFPSGGRPFGQINIGRSIANLGTNTAEHVITHELGHTVGFRHSDYFNRSISCGQGGNEGGGGVGAIHVPGTPSGAVVGGSIMNSCFRSSENGEFTNSDVTALRRLY